MERCISPERMPLLEPLSAPEGEPNTGPDPLPATSRTWRNIGQPMHDVVAPLTTRLVLENKGNVARDHLASERTYLSYVRTSLACAGAGIALMQLLTRTTGEVSHQKIDPDIDLNTFARPLGAALVLFGLVILLFGLIRYFSTQSALVRGYFPVARNSIMLIAFVLGSLVVIVFGVSVAGTLSG